MSAGYLSRYSTRLADPHDAPAIARLLAEYMVEVFDRTTPVTADTIRRDGFGEHFEMVVAVRGSGSLVGFTAWERCYDLHWGLVGGTVLDMFVTPEHRGRGVAPMMLTRTCAHVRERGGQFVRGKAVDFRSSRLYERAAMPFPGTEFILGGRAFRHIAELQRAGPRVLARSLPSLAWNHEE